MKARTVKYISQKLLAGFLAVTMIITGVVIVPETVDAASEVYFATADEYKMSDYWFEEGKKVPVKEGYVFSGWYDEDKTTPLKQVELTNESVNDIKAVARFVPVEVLSVKTQAALGNASSSLRMLSSVDSTNYQEVGFEYKLGKLKEGETEKITTVFKAIKPYEGASDEEMIYPESTFVAGVSTYFIAVDVENIASGSYEKIVYARPYWITMDGTKVMGLARNNRIIDKQNNNQYTSVGINLLADGKEAAKVAAGKIQVTYNTANYNVVSVDTTYADNVGGKYLFKEMECRIDETEGIITFVGNADIVNKELVELLADGLFANVRFEKAQSATGTALDFAINTKATSFCDWEEKPVTEFVVQ